MLTSKKCKRMKSKETLKKLRISTKNLLINKKSWNKTRTGTSIICNKWSKRKKTWKKRSVIYRMQVQRKINRRRDLVWRAWTSTNQVILATKTVNNGWIDHLLRKSWTWNNQRKTKQTLKRCKILICKRF